MKFCFGPRRFFAKRYVLQEARRVWRMISLAEQYSAKSSMDFRNSTPRERSRATKIVIPALGASAGSQISTETPIEIATFQGHRSPEYYNRSKVSAAVFGPKFLPFLTLGIC